MDLSDNARLLFGVLLFVRADPGEQDPAARPMFQMSDMVDSQWRQNERMENATAWDQALSHLLFNVLNIIGACYWNR